MLTAGSSCTGTVALKLLSSDTGDDTVPERLRCLPQRPARSLSSSGSRLASKGLMSPRNSKRARSRYSPQTPKHDWQAECELFLMQKAPQGFQSIVLERVLVRTLVFALPDYAQLSALVRFMPNLARKRGAATSRGLPAQCAWLW